MSSSNVKSYGKIRYIEPNEILEKSLYSGEGSFNIPHPYEDYSISVDLIVTIPNRMGYVTTKSGDFIEVSGKNNSSSKTSFFSGENGYLTDTPTTIIYKDILNGVDTKQNLGITNIHITYNSYFYPEVTINFVDVRGGALMMPHEENYRRDYINKNIANNGGNNLAYDTTVENFFSSLFSFPYPEFKLQIKGFYGKKVEYSLLVSDFRSSFNNETGNFDATVKFIGKMYGVYTDIPMSYLLIAPYCRYGGNNNLTIWESKNFKFDDGTPIPTFSDLKEKILTSTYEMETMISTDTLRKYEKMNNLHNIAQNINTLYNQFLLIFKNDLKDSVIVYDNTILCKKIDENYDYLKKHQNNILSEITKSLYNSIVSFNEEKDGNMSIEISHIKAIEGANTVIGTNKKYEITITKNDEGFKIDSERGVFSDDELNNIEDIFSHRHFADNSSETYFCILCDDFVTSLNKVTSHYKEEVDKIENESNDELTYSLRGILGFEPTVKNIFMILMAHLQAFIEIYCSFISNVTGVKSRTMKEYGLSFENTFDLPNNVKNKEEMQIPPFPGLRNKKDNTFCYPNRQILGKGKVMEEERLINALFDSTLDFVKENALINKLEEGYVDESLSFIPTCIMDLILGEHGNPYQYDFNKTDSTILVDWIMLFFGMRCVTQFLIENNRLKPEEFGKCEAYNFWRVNRNLCSKLLNKITNTDFNSSNFINFLLGSDLENNPYILNKKPCYSFNEKSKKLIFTENGVTKFNNDINCPVMIGRSSDSVDAFLSDMVDNEGIYSLGTGDTRVKHYPCGVIKLIEKTDLEFWNEKLKSFDNSPYYDETSGDSSNGDKSKSLIERFIPNRDYTEQDVISSNTYNILFKEEGPEFFFNNNGNKPSAKTFHSTYIEDFEKNTKLEYFQTLVDNSPIFFSENLTPSLFLKQIPFNFDVIEKQMASGSNVITLPYSFILFIGMLIYEIKRIKNESATYDKFKTNLNDFLYGGTNNLFVSNLLFNYGYKLEGLFNIISFLTRDENGNISYDKNKIIKNAFNTEDIYSALYTDSFFFNDFLGLEEKYIDWANDTKIGGFIYFKRKYGLELKEVDSLVGSTLTNKLYSYLTSKTSKPDEINNEIDSMFKVSYDEYNDTETPFKTRYSSITIVTSGVDYGVWLSLNESFDAYYYLNDFMKKTCKIVIPFSFNGKTLGEGSINNFETAFNSFKNKLVELYNSSNEDYFGDVEDNTMVSYNISEENKLAMYKTLKDLYDKHFSDLVSKKELYDIKNEDGEFGRFHFVDTFFNDISDKLIINLETLKELLDVVTNGYENGKGEGNSYSEMSVYSFMSLICQKHNLMLLSLPVFNGSFTNKSGLDNFSDMFKPFPYNDVRSEQAMSGPTYVCFYPHQASQHLDISNGQYSNDGFNITDLNDTGNFAGDVGIEDLIRKESEDYVIPSFGVEYGSQKQSIFKNVNINMDSPQTTEVAVATQFELANQNKGKVRGNTFQGQDLFKIYSNYSYTCNVEMMGCAQISPLMYFQLNNIPMFRGAYQIIQVEHNISPGDMSTSFRGVRINKTKVPMFRNCISTTSIKNTLNNYSNKNKLMNKPLNIIDLPIEKSMVNFLKDSNFSNKTYNDLIRDYGGYITFANNTQKEVFDSINPKLRNIIYCILGDLKELSSRLNYKLGMLMSSSVRYDLVNNNKKSDHLTYTGSTPISADKFNPSGRRIQLGFTNQGCAIDIRGTRNGKEDRGEASVMLFNLIANNYSDFIRQLIWEVTEDQSLSENRISLIHLASYGEVGPSGSDKSEIFIATKASNYSAVNTGNKGLPNEFLRVLIKMSKNERLIMKRTGEKGAGVKVLNYLDKQPTTEFLIKEYNKSLSV